MHSGKRYLVLILQYWNENKLLFKKFSLLKNKTLWCLIFSEIGGIGMIFVPTSLFYLKRKIQIFIFLNLSKPSKLKIKLSKNLPICRKKLFTIIDFQVRHYSLSWWQIYRFTDYHHPLCPIIIQLRKQQFGAVL